MSIGSGLKIFFLSLIALAAEIVLYFTFGMGAAISNNAGDRIPGMIGYAIFFGNFMVFTGLAGLLYLISCIVAVITKKEVIGKNLFLSLMSVVIIFCVVSVYISNKAASEALITVSSENSSARAY